MSKPSKARVMGVIQRVWRCRIEPKRADEYEHFARHVSMPMFRRQMGFRGCVMARKDDRCEVLTLWENDLAVEALERSPSYRETVAMIRKAGFIVEELGTSLLVAHDLSWPG